MYLRETRRKNKDGTVVSYLQLAHNERHPQTGTPTAKVIHNFGRADQVDREALRRLVASVSRFLEPAQAVAATAGSDVEIIDSRRFGGAFVLDQLWERLGIGPALRRAAAGRRLDAGVTERVLFALVANRCLEPSSKLAACRWVTERAAILSCPAFDDDAAYAAMDFLLAALGEIAEEIFARTANLLNLSCDVIFVDTSSTYFEVDVADELAELATALGEQEAKGQVADQDVPDEEATRRFSKNSKDDLAGWSLHRVVWVADSGFNSAANRGYLQKGGGHYIVAERVRGGSAEARAALARAGRYHAVAGNLEVKQVRLGDGARSQRFVICHNPEVAARDKIVRGNLLAYLQDKIAGTDDWPQQRRDELAGELRTTPALFRLLRRTKDGKLRISKGAVANEARFDGKFLLRTSDDTLTPADLAAAYKQLYQVERGWRDLKGALRLRPVFHYREDRIRAHIQLCWLALLLIRTIEYQAQDTWRNIRHELDRMHLVTLQAGDGRVAQRSVTTPGQQHIFKALRLTEPARFHDFELAEPAE